MEFEKLDPQPIRLEGGADAPYFPEWACFCCEDRGYLGGAPLFAVMPAYSSVYGHKSLCCKRRGCLAGQNLFDNPNYDQRLSPATCEKLHQWQLADWRETARLQRQRKEQGADHYQENYSRLQTLIVRIADQQAISEAAAQARAESARVARALENSRWLADPRFNCWLRGLIFDAAFLDQQNADFDQRRAFAFWIRRNPHYLDRLIPPDDF